jgi:hypothetical protein
LPWQDLKPLFLRAVEDQDAAALAAVQLSLLQHEQLLLRALKHASPTLSHSSNLILQAAVYDLFELLLFCEQLLGTQSGGNQSEVVHAVLSRLGRCLSILGHVSKGAELHVYLASRMLQYAVDFRGSDSVAAEAAAALFQEAHMLRYGNQIEDGMMLKLMDANKHAAEEFLM